jgi:hypothetical protein
MIAYIDGLINKDTTDRDIIAPLKSPDFKGDVAFAITAQYNTTEDFLFAVTEMLNGNVAVFYETATKS